MATATLQAFPPVTITGAQTAHFLMDTNSNYIEMPVTKSEITREADDGDVSGSTSVVDGVLCKEWSPGASQYNIETEGHWRTDQEIPPTDFGEGETYLGVFYTRRPGWDDSNDPGEGYWAFVFVKTVRLPLDTHAPSVEWKVSYKVQGPLYDTNDTPPP
jgi:hypothetical protein